MLSEYACKSSPGLRPRALGAARAAAPTRKGRASREPLFASFALCDFARFTENWATKASSAVVKAAQHARAQADDDAQQRAERAASRANSGELSAASAALTVMPMAPALLESLTALRNLDAPALLAPNLVPAQCNARGGRSRGAAVRMYSKTPPGACG